MAARRAHAFIFEKYFCRSFQGFFQRQRSYQRRRAPYLIHALHFFRNRDPSLAADLLLNQIHGKYRRKHVRCDRLSVRTYGRIQLYIRKNIIPLTRHLMFFQQHFSDFHLSSILSVEIQVVSTLSVFISPFSKAIRMLSRIPLINAPDSSVPNFLPMSMASLIDTLCGISGQYSTS